MAHGQPWQDETVQALKQGYQDEINKLLARIQELETAGREYRRVSSYITQDGESCMFCGGIGVRKNHKKDCRFVVADDTLAALLNNPPLEKKQTK